MKMLGPMLFRIISALFLKRMKESVFSLIHISCFLELGAKLGKSV